MPRKWSVHIRDDSSFFCHRSPDTADTTSMGRPRLVFARSWNVATMPSQLFNRLQNFLDASVAQTINGLERPANNQDLTDAPITSAALHDSTTLPTGVHNTHPRW